MSRFDLNMESNNEIRMKLVNKLSALARSQRLEQFE